MKIGDHGLGAGGMSQMRASKDGTARPRVGMDKMETKMSQAILEAIANMVIVQLASAISSVEDTS